MRAVRARIALLSSNFGRGVSGTARCWAGRIAVTQHITGPSASRQTEGSFRAGRGFWCPLDRIKAATGGRLVASWTVARGFGASGAGCFPRGSGAAAPCDALGAIDASACPRSWRTCGPRRLRRQSQPALIATQGDAAAKPAPATTPGRSEQQSFLHDGRTRASPPWAAKRPACADGPLRVMLAHLGRSSVASRGTAGRRWIDAAGEEKATRRRHRR